MSPPSLRTLHQLVYQLQVLLDDPDIDSEPLFRLALCVYEAHGQPFGPEAESLVLWIEHETWTTMN